MTAIVSFCSSQPSIDCPHPPSASGLSDATTDPLAGYLPEVPLRTRTFCPKVP